jgi:hypothetical protein
MKGSSQRFGLPVAIVALFCIYFPVAYWTKVSYIPDPNSPPPSAGIPVRLLPHDYTPMGDFAATVRDVKSTFEDVGDTAQDDHRSPVQLYENNVKLGPAHSTVQEIVNEGHGRFRQFVLSWA